MNLRCRDSLNNYVDSASFELNVENCRNIWPLMDVEKTTHKVMDGQTVFASYNLTDLSPINCPLIRTEVYGIGNSAIYKWHDSLREASRYITPNTTGLVTLLSSQNLISGIYKFKVLVYAAGDNNNATSAW